MMRAAGVVLALLALAACNFDDSARAAGDDGGAPPDAATPCESVDDCDDANPCTADTCTAGVCEHEAAREDEDCNDGLACTEQDHCQAGACVGAATDCSFLDDFCVAASCVEAEGGCVVGPRPDGTECDDGHYCTIGDECTDGVCGGTPRECDDVAGDCSAAACDDDASACVPVPLDDDDACEDGLACTTTDSCQGGSCVGGPPPACDDGDACTANVCDGDPDACDNPPIPPIPDAEGPPGDATCNDSTDNDCDGLSDLDDPECGDCFGDADCEDGNACTTDDCNVDGECDNIPLTGTSCDDGDYCTDDDECDAGLCVPGAPRACSDGDACTLDQCDEDANACANPARAIDPASPVDTSAGAAVCLVAGSGARAIAWAQLRDTDGDPITGATVTIGGDAAAESSSQPGTYWVQIDAAAAPASQNLVVVADACGSQVQLSTTVAVDHTAANDTGGGTGGCSPTGGNLRVRVVSAETGAPLAGARVLVGQAQGTPFQHAVEALWGGAPTSTSNVATADGDGWVELYDLGAALDGAVTVTAGADDRAYVTFADTSASDLVLPLPLLHPAAVPSTTYTTGHATASVSNCNDLDVALVLPHLDLSFFTDLDLGRFFGASRCWDSMNDNVGVVSVSDNFWIAQQSIGPFCFGGQVQEGTWSTTLPNTAATGETEDVALLHVRIPISDVQDVLGGGAPITSLLSYTTYRGIGFMLDESVPTAPTSGRTIAVTDDYPNAFTVTYSSKPDDTDIIGFVLGDHDGGNGVGPLAVIGHKVHAWDVAGSTVAIPNSDFNQAGAPSVRRLASVSALYLDPTEHTATPIAANRQGAVSTVLLRGGNSAPFGTSGGTATVTDFLDLAGTDGSTPGVLRWGNASRNGNLPMYSRHDLVVETSRYLPVLSCATENQVREEESAQWIVYRPFGVACGGDECVTLPTLPASFPRASSGANKRSGFEALVGPGDACGSCPGGSACVDPDGGGAAGSMCMAGAGTANDPYTTQAYRWRLHVYDLGLAPSFDFDDFALSDHASLVTHESANKAALP